MRVRYLLGPAGSGKTHRCLAEIRTALLAAPDGPPLVLLAPKQMTYQLERQLLADESLPGYTRLQVLSFERLAFWMLDELGEPEPRLLDAEGRVMVLRALLARERANLRLFRASARLTGFAQELSGALAEFQSHQVTPDQLRAVAAHLGETPGIAAKLHDFALLLESYLVWLNGRELQDAESLLDVLAFALRRAPAQPRIAGLWVDGFAEFAPQEVAVLAALTRHCEQATVTFCLDREPKDSVSWISTWSVVRHSFERCKTAFTGVPDCSLKVELLARKGDCGRFSGNGILQHLEHFWAEPEASAPKVASAGVATSKQEVAESPPGFGVRQSAGAVADCTAAAPPEPTAAGDRRAPGRRRDHDALSQSLRVVECANAEAEAVLAAREILRFVRTGGRFREVTVLVRSLESYHAVLQRVFARYEIPCFLDRRESVSHHPLAELTRSALRTVARDWRNEDWFAALKSGLVPAEEDQIDRLENEALAHGWQGPTWLRPLTLADDPARAESFERLRKCLVPPFSALSLALGGRQGRPNGLELAAALREFWRVLQIEAQLEAWAETPDRAVGRAGGSADQVGVVHLTVWEEMNAWLENLERAFPGERLALGEWLPILDAGLGSLTVGVIPPALDQVRIGAVNRSRNPDVKLALVLGLNEGVFPARPTAGPLLTETELTTLAELGVALSSLPRRQIGRERHFGYVACTRARQQLILTAARADAEGKPLNLSPFVARLTRLFPRLEVEQATRNTDGEALHVQELIPQLLALPEWPGEKHGAGIKGYGDVTSRFRGQSETIPLAGLEASDPAGPETCPTAASPGQTSLSSFLPSLVHLRDYAGVVAQDRLSPVLADRLYGPTLRSSVSRLEQFAACPFKFFVYAGLRAEERVRFELDAREQGSYQHDVLASFHEQLRREGKRWRDVTPEEARARVGRIAQALATTFHEGLFSVSGQTRFAAQMLTDALQDFVEVLVGWMREQYDFDPVAVELPFGEEEGAPAWALDLGAGRRLALRGRIDRVDLCRGAAGEEALCVVVDYKSSQKELDPVLLANGVQLQLPAYLSVLQHWREPRRAFCVARLRPAGVFYVSLRGLYDRQANRADALANPDEVRRLAYQHAGRFDASALLRLDRRGAPKGDQFNYRRKQDGELMKNCREAMSTADFANLLRATEDNLNRMGREILAGAAQVDPYRHKQTIACDQCTYQAICRIDPWTHRYRTLRVARGEG